MRLKSDFYYAVARYIVTYKIEDYWNLKAILNNRIYIFGRPWKLRQSKDGGMQKKCHISTNYGMLMCLSPPKEM